MPKKSSSTKKATTAKKNINTPKNISTQNQVPFLIAHKVATLYVLSAVVFLFAGASWWKHVYNSPHRVFDAMLSNNLSTSGVTRETKNQQGGSNIDKIEKISFVPESGAHSLVDIKQNGNGANSDVQTETLGSITADFSRYNRIKTSQKNAAGKTLDYSSVQGIWGKSVPGESQPQYFNQAVLGIIPFANLNAETKAKVLKVMADKKAYTVDYAAVKPLKIDGKSVLVFPVSVDTAGYVEALNLIIESIGLQSAKLDPSQYKGQPPISIVLTVDKLSRHLLEASISGQQKESYSAYGITTPLQFPDKTIPVTQLQQKVQAIK